MKRKKLSYIRMLSYIFLASLSLFVMLQGYYLAQIAWWINHNPKSTSFMRERLAIMREKNLHAQLKQNWVDYDHISNNLKRAIIASEDANFIEHDGVDWRAIWMAYEKNNKNGRIVYGGSTITQQLAKNLFLSSKRSYFRKGQELIITWMLETVMDKERIFEIYLNVVEWGNGIFGAQAAARHYFGISAAQLGAKEASRLAVILPNPRKYDLIRDSTYLEQRTALIFRRMKASDVP